MRRMLTAALAAIALVIAGCPAGSAADVTTATGTSVPDDTDAMTTFDDDSTVVYNNTSAPSLRNAIGPSYREMAESAGVDAFTVPGSEPPSNSVLWGDRLATSIEDAVGPSPREMATSVASRGGENSDGSTPLVRVSAL